MLFLSLIYFIFSNAVASSKNIAILYSRSTLIIFLFSKLLIFVLFYLSFFEKPISIYNGLIYFNLSVMIFIFFLFLLSFFILLLTSFYPLEEVKGMIKLEKIDLSFMHTTREDFKIIEYPLLILFILIGSIALLSSNDLVTLFLAIELQSYGLYIISTIYRNSESSTNAGLTYFLLGGLSSCIILLGQGFLYINSGTTSLDALYIIHNIITSEENLMYYMVDENFYSIYTLNFYQYALQISLIILSVGLLFKISAAPFHSWSPSVYDGIPTVTTTFVAIIPKISILILFFDLVYSTWYSTFDFSWTSIFLFSSFLSLIIGSILGLTQTRIKRLYAYSTISHIGFILLALSVHSIQSIQAFFFYIIQYSLSNLNAFLILVCIGYSYEFFKGKTKVYSLYGFIKEIKQNMKVLSPVEYIDQLKGYFYLNPVLAISLSITLYSFIGIPPLVGFFAKQMILSSALDNGYIFICLVAILTSVISAVYYLYIIKHMFFEKGDYVFYKWWERKVENIDNVYTLNNKYNIVNSDFTSSMEIGNTTVIESEKQNAEKQSAEKQNLDKKNTHVICASDPDLVTLNELLPDLYKVKFTLIISRWLTWSISVLTLIILLFMFLYYEIYFLMNILGIFIVY